jgi:hypothetical protein
MELRKDLIPIKREAHITHFQVNKSKYNYILILKSFTLNYLAKSVIASNFVLLPLFVFLKKKMSSNSKIEIAPVNSLFYQGSNNHGAVSITPIYSQKRLRIRN